MYGSWRLVSLSFSGAILLLLTGPGGGSEEIMSELAIREEVKDLMKLASASSKL
jgi:hypothetical protein